MPTELAGAPHGPTQPQPRPLTRTPNPNARKKKSSREQLPDLTHLAYPSRTRAGQLSCIHARTPETRMRKQYIASSHSAPAIPRARLDPGLLGGRTGCAAQGRQVSVAVLC
jgi:hypothetical protein